MYQNYHYTDSESQIRRVGRAGLMDWLIGIHRHFKFLPETLLLAVNCIDRFLSRETVSPEKLHLVGAAALLSAAKYEEGYKKYPSENGTVCMVDRVYTTEEILKTERFMLNTLEFDFSWPGPMGFLCRINKADDDDTLILAKYFLEVAIMDRRLVAYRPSLTAAGAYCLARFMVRGRDWSERHVHYSQYTYRELEPLVTVILECCENPIEHHHAVALKYAEKRDGWAPIFVQDKFAEGFMLPPVE